MSDKPSILIIGDWFIDENWLMANCDIYHSYNVGDAHFIGLLKDATSSSQSLCGVASILRILYGPAKKACTPEMQLIRDRYHLIGAGVWNPSDNLILQCVMCPEYCESKRRTPYILSGLEQPKHNDGPCLCPHNNDQPCQYDAKIYNLADAKKAGGILHFSTNRLIRIYEGFGSDQPKLRSRYDWRLEIRPEWISLKELTKIKRENTSIKAVVIVDHGHGVIGPQVIHKLLKLFPEAEYYVRSKLASPGWFKEFVDAKKRFKLAFTDQQLVAYRKGVRVWQHGPAVVGRGALEVLSDLLGLPWYEHNKKQAPESSEPGADAAAILFDNNAVVAASREPGGEDATLVNVFEPRIKQQPIRVGRSSVFFDSLIYWDLMRPEGLQCSIRPACIWAEQNAYRWTVACTEAWMKEEPSELSGPFETAIYMMPRADQGTVDMPGPVPANYKTSWTEWNDSSKELGLVTVGGEDQIQLWRAYGVLKDYVCTGGEKRTNINRLIHNLGKYWKDRKTKYPFNCLFLAEPGWGKSYLARCLAEHFDFEFLRYSIAQMASNSDLIDAFKVIASTQNRTHKKVLVFIDEIDAKIENHTAMGLLLGPMWDGQFKLEGNLYSIAPCIWVFASTKHVDELAGEPKGRDFLSRINGPIIDLDFLTNRKAIHAETITDPDRIKVMKQDLRDCSYLRTEMVYLGVSLLNQQFGPISKIDKAVLEIFYNIMPKNGIRSLEVFVSQFSNISRGRVTRENVPDLNVASELRRHIDVLDSWPPGATYREVKVLINPPK